MFWSGNYIAVRELNFLLKEENVTLSQVLEADDILQECKANNKNLMQFLTRPDILAELITLITEEPPQNVELTAQYRLASIACEVLTSDLATLSDQLSMNVTQMNRLCDFICKPPPLNPLLASYFSKTVEMLLDRSTKQDWYIYHIVCLRVLDFFKSRREFLPNLLRHMATSAIADTFKYFIRLDDLFNKIVMEWFDEHQLLESLLQVVCGGYLPDSEGRGGSENMNHNDDTAKDPDNNSADEPAPWLPRRLQAIASDNACALLCDVIASGDARTRTIATLTERLQSEECVRQLLQNMFTSRPQARPFAVVSGCRLLLALLAQEPIISTGEIQAERSAVELAVAPHLPLLHQALLADPRGNGTGVGLPRLHLASLVAQLALSELDEVCNALRALGTPGVLINMLFEYPDNNFLHGAVYTMVKHALHNRVYRTQYAQHLLLECDLLTRLMDVYEEHEGNMPTEYQNQDQDPENQQPPPIPRAAYMGHVIMMLDRISRALDDNLLHILPEELAQRWANFEPELKNCLQQRSLPLGGQYPSENTYEADSLPDNLSADYEFPEGGAEDDGEVLVNGIKEVFNALKSNSLWTPAEIFGEHRSSTWDEISGEEEQPSDTWLPWEQEGGEQSADWAQFESLAAPPPPADPFADTHGAAAGDTHTDEEFSPFWPPPAPTQSDDHCSSLERSVEQLQLDASSVSLATNLLTAMSALPPDQLADLVSTDLNPVMPTNSETSRNHDETSAKTEFLGNTEDSAVESVKDESGNTVYTRKSVLENVQEVPGDTDKLKESVVENLGDSSGNTVKTTVVEKVQEAPGNTNVKITENLESLKDESGNTDVKLKDNVVENIQGEPGNIDVPKETSSSCDNSGSAQNVGSECAISDNVGPSSITDTGSTDSGTTDSGTKDSGTTDSGGMDSGSCDSGATDS